jgi:proprotein convertase subtilisin/kexin type 5
VTDPQYFYNLACYSACPDGTYSSGFTCLICDTTVAECATCFGSPTNCTSCLNSKYLNQPIYGSCIVDCPISGAYTVKDVVNYQCVSTCSNNLILINNTCNYCTTGFKLISNSSCVASCPDFFYSDIPKHLCSRCDSSCLTCSGPYA